MTVFLWAVAVPLLVAFAVLAMIRWVKGHWCRYENWEYDRDVTVCDDLGGRKIYQTYEGSCRVCGRPKIRRQR